MTFLGGGLLQTGKGSAIGVRVKRKRDPFFEKGGPHSGVKTWTTGFYRE